MKNKKEIEKQIRKLLKDKNRVMYPSDISKKLNIPYWDVDNVLEDMQKRGLVEHAKDEEVN